jgi:poly-beta-hydroxyalkanoate depolymerase
MRVRTLTMLVLIVATPLLAVAGMRAAQPAAAKPETMSLLGKPLYAVQPAA